MSGVARALNDPFRDYAHDSELRLAIGHKLMELVANGVNDPVRVGYLCLGNVTNRRSSMLPGGYKPLGGKAATPQ